jgi:uncharacterized protein (TIGR02246 family)
MMADIQEMHDRLAIRELVDRYTLAVTRRDWDAVAACFHEDARWHASVGYDFRGRTGIREGLREVVEGMELLVQMTHGITIDVLTPERARATSVLNEFGRMPGGEGGVFVLGLYYDTVAKVGGRWGFEERDFQLHYIDASPPPGNVTVDYKNQPHSRS